MTSKEAGKQAS